MSMSSTYQPPSPSSSSGSLHSVVLARSRSTSAEGQLPEPKRTRASDDATVNEWVATLNLTADAVESPSGYESDSPHRRHSPHAELPTPATTPPSPHCASFSPEHPAPASSATLKARLLARAATLQAQGAFNVQPAQAEPRQQPAPVDQARASSSEAAAAGCKDQLVQGLVGESSFFFVTRAWLLERAIAHLLVRLLRRVRSRD